MIKKLNKFKKVFAIACAVAVVGTFAPSINASAASTTVSIDAPASAKVGETIKIAINVQNVSGLYGGAVDFAYDTNLLKVDSIKFGDLTNNAKADVTKNTAGQSSIAFTLKGNATPISKSGQLAEITATVKSKGEMTLKTSQDYSEIGKNGINTVVKLADKNASKIAYSANTKKITFTDKEVPPVDGVLGVGTHQAENNPDIKYTRKWTKVDNAKYDGGSTMFSNVGKSTAEFKFKGTSFEWHGIKAKPRGKALVNIDGVDVATVDCYNPTTVYNTLIYKSSTLANKEHSVKITVLSSKTPAATAIGFDIDKIVVKDTFDGPTLAAGTYQDNDSKLMYTGTWAPVNGTNYDKGSINFSNTANSTVEFAFNGTSFEWYGIKAKSRGKALITIDGKDVTTVDLYQAKTAFNTLLYKSNTLSNGKHIVKITVLKEKNASASAIGVDVDKIVIK